MNYDNALAAAKLRKWESYLKGYDLPSWNDLPGLDLYMDQIIVLLTQYMQLLPQEEDGGRLITSSIINNYVRMKLIPPPCRKKYSRVHLAYLIMICTLKQSLSISNIQKLLPADLSEEEVRVFYEGFVANYESAAQSFLEQVTREAAPILDLTSGDPGAAEKLIISSAMHANLYALLSKKLILLEPPESGAD